MIREETGDPFRKKKRRQHEQATQRENDDVLNALNQESKHIVTQINSALHRIETGDYGVCTQCGAEISEGRLEIVPYAALCIKCAEKSD